jgi:hypothetical protein
VKILKKLLDNYELKKTIVTYVKDAGSNLNIMTTTLKLVVSCDVLGLKKSFQVTYFVMHFLKHVNMQQKMIFFAKA